ncbi:hypothetical protein LUZ63_010167 [Rhynchospora breviuscula]|uniref:TOM1-like protein 2 n=1 Tax=Rhynchospora breviuscula TaxID=2022672 RepID=A0A9Q0CHA0_9POAL|nr:hypothetical protein LUZ63_010167 [Rhynchospora breviuscula]
MSDGMADKVTALGQRLKVGGAEVGRKVTARMSSMSGKLREFLQGPNEADQIVENATSANLSSPDWSANLEICDRVNTGVISGVEIIRAVKKRIMMSQQPTVQYLALVLLEAIVKNCERGFADVAAERVLDEMVRVVDNPETVVSVRDKVLALIEAWGESGEELQYLPMYEVTYKSLKLRGIRFPGRDDESLAPIFTPPRTIPEVTLHTDAPYLTTHETPPVPSFTSEQTKEEFSVARNTIELLSTVLSSSPQKDAQEDDLTSTLVQQCHQSQHTIQKIIEASGSNDEFLLEALNINEELQKMLSKYEELKKPQTVQAEPEPATIPVVIELDVPPHETLTVKPASTGTQSDGGDQGLMHHKDDFISL